ncbi:MAG: histidine kinase [bacterium]
MKQGFLIGFLILLFPVLKGQQYYSRNYTMNDGLPGNVIHSIMKDSGGRMWIGTGSGLCQFDGRVFRVMGSSVGMVGDNVFSVTEDDAGNIWAGCMKGGISKFDGKKFTNYTVRQGLVSNNVRVVWFSRKFRLLFVGTNDGCSVFDGKNFINLTTQQTRTDNFYVMGFLEGPDFVTLYPYDSHPPYRYYPQTRTFTRVSDDYYTRHSASTSPLLMPDGDTIIGNLRDGINLLNNGIRQSFKNMGQVFGMCSGENGDIWIAAWSENPWVKEMPGGLFLYNGKKVIPFSEKVGISDGTVWSVYYDSTFHILWVGTLNSGLYKIPIPAFEWFDENDFGIKSLNVKSLFPDRQNNLWIGTEGSLFVMKPDTVGGLVNPGNLKKMMTINNTHAVEISCIQSDSHGNIYAGSVQSVLKRFSSPFKHSNPSTVRVLPGATHFCFGPGDTLFYTDKWWDKIYYGPLDQGISSPLIMQEPKPDGQLNITKLIAQGDTIWYSSKSEGLMCSIHGKLIRLIRIDTSLARIINDFCFDNCGNIIIGDNSGKIQIARYGSDGFRIRHELHPGKDLVGNSVRFVVVDGHNNLFAGTNLGLNRVDLVALYEKDTLIANFYNGEVGYYDCTGKVTAVDRNGYIWIGTDKHLMRINDRVLDHISSFALHPKITGIDLNYQSLEDFEKVSRFPSQDNNLTFHFRNYNYLNPEQSFYRYKLEGLSNHWSDFSTQREAVFTSLNPGKYRLIVESFNTVNRSLKGRTEYSFEILFPWYLRWWSVGGIVMVIIILVLMIISYRTDRIRREEKKKSDLSKHLAEIEMKALQSQMNPHFIFNSINSIQGFILKNKVDEALGYLNDFARILRQTLDNAVKEYITLEEEIEYITRYLKLEMMRFDYKFIVSIGIPDDLDTHNVQIPPMIIQPHVENAIRHGLVHKMTGKGTLNIQISIENDEKLRCVIEDNGVGRKKSREIEKWKKPAAYQPHSTRITEDRIELLNEAYHSDKYSMRIIDLHDEKGVGSGTRVELVLPLVYS